MIIIDRKTGKRLVNPDTDLMKEMGKKDPVKRIGEKSIEGEESSPMDPPDAYSREHLPEEVNAGEMSGFLQKLAIEHREVIKKTEEFEKALVRFREEGYRFSNSINEAFASFFEFIDSGLISHHAREEKILFPLLHRRLIESGESSPSVPPKTAVDMMEDDHVKFIQLSTLTFNMLGLATRIGHGPSRIQVFDVACSNGRELAELLKLHIFREDNILFPTAHRLISKEEFRDMEIKISTS